jgi:phosphoribosylformimino-5-aminoimidazole carboxamide ribotide isomerase
MLIYPAIDIYQGKCVRLRQGDYATSRAYADSPAAVARGFVESGLHRIHVVDLEGAKQGRIVNREAIESILRVSGIQVHVGGGVRSRIDVSQLFGAGAARLVIGSVAVKKPDLVQEWFREFRSDRFVIAVDVWKGALAHSGWLAHENVAPSAFIESMARLGASYFLCTDIQRDGMLDGPNAALYTTLREQFPALRFLASGGVSKMADIEDLKKAGCWAAVVGKALYEGNLKPSDLSQYSEA